MNLHIKLYTTTKEILNYYVSSQMSLEIALVGLDRLFSRLPLRKRKKLVVHSDQGFHYTHKGYRNLLSKYEVKQSMSRKGNCLDNAPVESFFGHLKDEVDLKSCETYVELKKTIKNYITSYNNVRPQWGLQRKTPAECRGLNW